MVGRAWDLDRVLKFSSEEVLVSWLVSDDNYTRWKSASRQGPITRIDLCDEISDLLHAQRIYHRTNSAICRKIDYLEQSVKKADALLASNGFHSSNMLDHCGTRLRSEVLERCLHFEVLAPVITAYRQQSASKDRNQSRPRLKVRRRQDKESSSDDEETEEEDDPVSLLSRRPPKATKSRTQRPQKKLQFLSWQSDHVRDKSSLDVLLSWLTSKSNYARWKESRQPSGRFSNAEVCTEIRNLMRAQGIQHRSNNSIRRKVLLLEDSIAKAHKFLVSKGLGRLETLGDCEQELKYKILRLCPEFERLSPVVGAYRFRHKPEFPSETQSRRPTASPAIAQKKKRARDTSIDEDAQDSFTAPKRRAVSSSPRNSGQDPEFHRRKTSHDVEVGIKQAWLQLEREKRKFELEVAQTKMRLELSVAQEQQESALVVVRALARQKLLNAGISKDEVDVLLPRKRLRE